MYFVNILQNKEPGIRHIFSPYFHLICFFPCVRLYLPVGKEQISQDGMVRLLTLQPRALAPHFADNDYVTALITWSTAHSHHQVLLACGLLCVIQIYELHLESSGITAASRLCPLGKPRQERR